MIVADAPMKSRTRGQNFRTSDIGDASAVTVYVGYDLDRCLLDYWREELLNNEHGINDRCGRFNVGDNDQRYEVFATDISTGKEFKLGWTNRADGGSLAAMVEKHPNWKDARVVDRLAVVKGDSPVAVELKRQYDEEMTRRAAEAEEKAQRQTTTSDDPKKNREEGGLHP